jgi:hypothetical protein
MAMRFILTLGWYLILFKHCKEGALSCYFLYLKESNQRRRVLFAGLRLLCALRQKRRCGTRRQKTLLKQSSLTPFLTLVLDCSKAFVCASRN